MRFTILLSILVSSAAAQTGPTFSLGNMDPTANPCVDFYHYACGGWMAKNPIPADESVWGQFNELAERNRMILRNILEKASADDPKRTAVEQKIGDFYESCMDEQAIDKLGLQPIQGELDRISALNAKSALVPELVRLQLIGVDALFSFSSSPDAKDSKHVIADADQGGLGLPDRDYYLKDDAKSKELRTQYLAHVQKMMELAGASADRAASDAQAVMRIETELAKGSLDRVSRRDPQKVYHKLSVQELAALCPEIDWTKFFQGLSTPAFTSLNVDVPDFFKALSTLLASTNLDDVKSYLRWHLIHSEAAFLPNPFVNENFHFYRQILTGVTEIQPRWKRCVAATDGDLGFALGQKYVEQTFGAEGKARTLKMVQEIEKALGDRYPRARLDDARHQAAGARQTARRSQ